MNRPKLYMLCGVPASGKSTWVGQNVKGGSVYVASTDNIIEAVAQLRGKTYSEVFSNTIKDAEKSMYTCVMEAVKDGFDIVWDQTNLNYKTRAKKLIMIPDHYEKIAVYFPVPDDLEKRLASRPGKNIPWNIIQSMINSFEVPGEFEGFDRICHAIKEECYV